MARHPFPLDPVHIFMWRRIDERITTSGQPDETQLAALKEIGVGHVINLGLHSHEKALPDEGGYLAELGIDYIHIPVDFDDPTEDDYARFRATMDALSEERVHIHCIANLRVSAFLYRYRRDARHMAEEKARQEMERIWKPGGPWASLIGDEDRLSMPHLYAGRDY